MPLPPHTPVLDLERRHHREPGPHCALGIVLTCLRIAEINQHAIAHEFRDETVEPGDRLADARDRSAKIRPLLTARLIRRVEPAPLRTVWGYRRTRTT
jgi:hypothetical protein